MRQSSRLLLAVVAMTLVIGASGFSQTPPPRPVGVPIKLQIVLSKDEQGRKVSAPYTLSTISSGVNSALRMGGEIARTTTSPDGQTRTTMEQVGTQISASVRSAGDGQFSVQLGIDVTAISPSGQPVQFKSQNAVTLRDGETTQYMPPGQSSGEAYAVAVTLTVVK